MKHSWTDSTSAIATILTPAERQRVDAAGEGVYRAIHRDSVDDVIADLRSRRVAAVLLSVARCGSSDMPGVNTLVREFPQIPAVALLTHGEGPAPQNVLALGRCGVKQLVDVRNSGGWSRLREVLVQDCADDVQRMALGQLAIDLAGAPPDCWRFFEMLFRSSMRVTTVRELARELGALPSTLMSRFFRTPLPAPKRYLAMARLTRAARLFENPGLSIANVANHLEYSSSQSFGRHVRNVLGMTAVQFRSRYDGEGMFQRFRSDLVLPHLDRLRRFSPLGGPPSWLAVPGKEPRARAFHVYPERSRR